MIDEPPHVDDWATDWDHHEQTWVADPFPIWDDLREHCPIAHTDRYNEGVWLPLRFDDLAAIAHDPATFSNHHNGLSAGGSVARDRMPPLSYDPPEHQELRRAILPFFAPRRVETWRDSIQKHCTELASVLAERGRGDAAVDYAQHIPVGAIAAILGVDPDDGDLFRSWINDFSELGDRIPELRQKANAEICEYMLAEIADRRRNPGDDLVSYLIATDVAGEPLDDDTIRRILLFQILAGIDTTWCSIGSALWHLATHPHDRERLAAEPALVPTAVEEFLRAYASAHVARRVARPATVNGVDMEPGDTVLMAFPAACRDPEAFDRADEVILDRQQNRHPAFGLGIHRCLGSNLARLEMNLAVGTWMEHIPSFRLAPDADVTWSSGQIRGPRTIPFVVDDAG